MIDFELVERLVRLLDDSGLDSLEIERGGTRIRLAKSAEGVQMTGGWPQASHAVFDQSAEGSVTPPSDDSGVHASPGLVDVPSPMVGTFYRAPAPDAPAYVEVGQTVSMGDTLCIIEAMKLMNELECETAGVIAEVLVENAEPVEYGQILFRVRPN